MFDPDQFPLLDQANRGLLYYLYYRSLGSAETVRGLSFTTNPASVSLARICCFMPVWSPPR